MSLKKYKQKRKLKGKKSSGEPKSTKISTSSNTGDAKKIFVIHKHYATHLHYDLRLQIGKVLKSWALPKTPPKTKGTKRLALQVEDHPLSYKDFEGTIPEGNYGAGKVKIWDKGKYEMLEASSRSMKFKLHGKKLNGDYVLVKTSYGKKPEKSWLFFKS